jgi:hypothetical protein
MMRCPVCGARIRGERELDGFLRCQVCRAKLRVTGSSRELAILYCLTILVIAAFLVVARGALFFLCLLLMIPFGVRNGLGSLVAVPELTSNRQTGQSGNEQTRLSAPRVQENRPDMNTSSPRDKRATEYCIYCGAVISESDWRFCANCGASLMPAGATRQTDAVNFAGEKDSTGSCMVCGLAIRDSEEVVYCIHCGNAAHRLHLLEWVHIKGTCPMCEERLTERDIK